MARVVDGTQLYHDAIAEIDRLRIREAELEQQLERTNTLGEKMLRRVEALSGLEPSANHGWDAAIESAEQRLSALQARLDEALKVLSDAEMAVRSLPQDTLGRDSQEGYFYRDELLSRLAAVAKEEQQ